MAGLVSFMDLYHVLSPPGLTIHSALDITFTLDPDCAVASRSFVVNFGVCGQHV